MSETKRVSAWYVVARHGPAVLTSNRHATREDADRMRDDWALLMSTSWGIEVEERMELPPAGAGWYTAGTVASMAALVVLVISIYRGLVGVPSLAVVAVACACLCYQTAYERRARV